MRAMSETKNPWAVQRRPNPFEVAVEPCCKPSETHDQQREDKSVNGNVCERESQENSGFLIR